MAYAAMEPGGASPHLKLPACLQQAWKKAARVWDFDMEVLPGLFTTLKARRDRAYKTVERLAARSRPHVQQFVENHVTFYRLHLSYFIVVACIGSLTIWLSPKHNDGIAFIDALFNVTSCLCVTGLVTVKMAHLSQFDKVVLVLMMLLGSQVFLSLLPVLVRRHYFKRYIREQRLKEEAAAMDQLARDKVVAGDVENVDVEAMKSPTRFSVSEQAQNEMLYRTFSSGSIKDARALALTLNISRALSDRLEGPRPMSRKQSRISYLTSVESDDAQMFLEPPTSKLLEHEALLSLSGLVPVYFIGVQLAGILAISLYLFGAADALQTLKERHVNRLFYAVFITVAAFSNAGISLLDDSFVPFQKSVILLLVVSFVILAGNTLFAPCMRFFVWVLYSVSHGHKKQVYKYLLEHPRRCYTHMFPRKQTIWLLLTVMAFNGVETLAFCTLDWSSTALKGLGAGYKVVVGLFQAVSTRNAGFNVVFLVELTSAMLFLYVGMMYIAVYPVFLSRQHTKAQTDIYDEADLGVYATNWESELVGSKISMQARRLLARDSAYLFIAIFIVCIIHNKNIKQDPLNFSLLNIVFEIISAYGNVGVSIGYSCDLARQIQPIIPCEDVPYSFSGKWSVAGKAIVVIVMFLGRHRGLPDNIDAAIQLPRRKDFSRKMTQTSSTLKLPRGDSAYNFSAPPHTLPPMEEGYPLYASPTHSSVPHNNPPKEIRATHLDPPVLGP